MVSQNSAGDKKIGIPFLLAFTSTQALRSLPNSTIAANATASNTSITLLEIAARTLGDGAAKTSLTCFFSFPLSSPASNELTGSSSSEDLRRRIPGGAGNRRVSSSSASVPDSASPEKLMPRRGVPAREFGDDVAGVSFGVGRDAELLLMRRGRFLRR